MFTTRYQSWMATEFMTWTRGPFSWIWFSVEDFVKAVNARGKNFRDPEQILKDYIAVSKKMEGVRVWDRRSEPVYDDTEVSLLRRDMISEFMLSWRRDSTEDDSSETPKIINPYLPAGFVKAVMPLVDLGVKSVGSEISGGQIFRTAHFFGAEEGILSKDDLATTIQEHRVKVRLRTMRSRIS